MLIFDFLSSEGSKNIKKSELELIICHVLKISSEKLITDKRSLLISDSHKKTIKSLIKRKIKGEPIAYIFGYKYFWKNKFVVTKDVLIPRPETEELIELVMTKSKKDQRLIELGTGSGAVSISLALEGYFRIYASDISDTALSIAKKNQKHLISKEYLSIHWKQGDLLEPWQSEISECKILVANLPYLPLKEKSNIMTEVSIYEPDLALYGGQDGSDVYKRLACQLQGQDSFENIFLEIDHSHSGFLLSFYQTYLPRYKWKLKKDLSGKQRFLISEFYTKPPLK